MANLSPPKNKKSVFLFNSAIGCIKKFIAQHLDVLIISGNERKSKT